MNQVVQPQSVPQPQVVPPSQPTSIQSNFMQNTTAFFHNHKKAISIVLAILGAIVLIKMIFFKSAVISVIGTGRLTAKPDKVEMLVTRVDSNPDPILAIMAGEESVNTFIAKAKKLAGDDVEIQKSFYQVTPSVVTGDVLYQVVNVFKITGQDPSKVTDMIKGFYAAGATTVTGVNFIPEDRDSVTQEARKSAIKDAKQQAKNIAKASGKRVGRIISIGDDLSKGSSTVSTSESAPMGENAPAQLNYSSGVPTDIDISKSMTVTYEIW